MNNSVKNAIHERKCLTISYPPGIRTIEPHALGWSKDGNLLLRAYQTEGASASGEHEHWKLFRIDRMNFANDNGECFDGPRPGYRRGDPAMKGGIIEEL